jgi:selenocysteine lyase/cysteine desulfurase
MELEKIRAETPGLTGKLFVNSAGSSLMPQPVLDRISEYFNSEQEYGGYKAAEIMKDHIDHFYTQSAVLLNCNPENIAFAFNATDAYSKALSSISFEEGDIILTTDDDYVSNYLNFLALGKKFGIRIERFRNHENGDLDLHDVEFKIKKLNPKLVAVTHVPTSSGLIQDVVSVGQLCASHDCIYLVDACQSAGQIDVDVQEIRCDFLSITGRKFLRGPRGTGLLYVSDRMLEEGFAPLFVDLRGAEWNEADHYSLRKYAKRFELWELPYALLSGLGYAIAYFNNFQTEQIEERNRQLMQRLLHPLKSVPEVRILDQGSRQSNILTFQKTNTEKPKIMEALDCHQVMYSVTERGNALIDFDKKGIDWAIRISPHYFNTFEEMDQLAEIIGSIGE